MVENVLFAPVEDAIECSWLDVVCLDLVKSISKPVITPKPDPEKSPDHSASNPNTITIQITAIRDAKVKTSAYQW